MKELYWIQFKRVSAYEYTYYFKQKVDALTVSITGITNFAGLSQWHRYIHFYFDEILQQVIVQVQANSFFAKARLIHC